MSVVANWGVRLVAGAALAGMPLAATAAAAQTYQEDRDYAQTAPSDAARYTSPPYNTGPVYDTAPEDDVPPPPDYDGSQPPPPPPGYQAQGSPVDAAQDQRYAAYVEDWSSRYCTKARSNAGVGAVIGGVVGALFGSSVAGWRDQGTGALVGGLAGAVGGAAIGSSSANATSPGCPPGYVVRREAPAFYYEGYGDPYLYAAPGWYQPWYSYGGRWAYRPYPYHSFYYGLYGYGRGFGGYRGGYGRDRGGYARGYGYGRGYGRGFRR